MRTSREIRRELERINARRSETLQPVPRGEWPTCAFDPHRIETWVSKDYLVQVFDEGNSVLRATVQRTAKRADGQWVDGITWDELQIIKHEIGRGDMWAVEIYPRNSSIVNDANMRHLWILPVAPAFGWIRENESH